MAGLRPYVPRPYRLTFSRRSGAEAPLRSPCYASASAALRAAERICDAMPWIVVSIWCVLDDGSRTFVRGVQSLQYAESLAAERLGVSADG